LALTGPGCGVRFTCPKSSAQRDERILADRIESKRQTTSIVPSGPRDYSAALFVLWCLTIMFLRGRKSLFVFLLLLAALGASVLILRPRSVLTLHPKIVVTHSETGIPGLSKWYAARITNRGPWPVVVTRCNAIDDGGGREITVAYAIERWNQKASRWDPVVVFDSSSFCKPYPLGIVEAQLKEHGFGLAKACPRARKLPLPDCTKAISLALLFSRALLPTTPTRLRQSVL
jgi:hypothetical protein